MKEEPAMGKCPGRAAQAQETGQEEIPKQARACLGPSVWRIRGKTSRRGKVEKSGQMFSSRRFCIDEFCSKDNENPLTLSFLVSFWL